MKAEKNKNKKIMAKGKTGLKTHLHSLALLAEINLKAALADTKPNLFLFKAKLNLNS